jgi:ribonuclease J
MQANANIAQQQGVPKQLLGSNGDLFVMAPQVQMKRKFVATSRIAISKDKDR